MKIGDITLDFLGHDGFIIANGVRVAIDPFRVPEGIEPVDLILITHGHFDHCSIADIEKISKNGTTIIGPADIQSSVVRVDGIHMHPLEVGDSAEFSGIKIEAVPAYNLNKFRDKDESEVFHSKKEGFLGYVLKMGKVVIYHAGDTDIIPEMKKLTGYGKHGNQFITLLPVSGTYVMDAEEAADAAKLLNSDLAIPMHYGAGVVGTIEDAERFVELCKSKGIRAEVLKKL